MDKDSSLGDCFVYRTRMESSNSCTPCEPEENATVNLFWLSISCPPPSLPAHRMKNSKKGSNFLKARWRNYCV